MKNATYGLYGGWGGNVKTGDWVVCLGKLMFGNCGLGGGGGGCCHGNWGCWDGASVVSLGMLILGNDGNCGFAGGIGSGRGL